jgi:predicted porin
MFNLGKKIHFVKKAKKNFRKAKHQKDDKNDICFGLHGKYDLYSILNEDGKVEYRLTMDGTWDGHECNVASDRMSRKELWDMVNRIEDLLKQTDPNLNFKK